MQTVITILGIVFSVVLAYASIVSTLVLRQLDAITKRQDAADARATRLEDEVRRLDARKAECQIAFTSKEDWVRSEGYMRQEMKEIVGLLGRMEGKLAIVDSMPQICGSIAGQVAEKILKGRIHHDPAN
jgi:hypothetical protein